MDLISITRRLARQVDTLTFSDPVAHVYNPLIYARAPHEQYLQKYGDTRPGRVLLVGMNPGPFGMAQTGVPFGEVTFVRDWLAISGTVGRPSNEHPKRPILGFSCTRSEVSGARIWGWAADRFTTASRFFEEFFIVNYCPLIFLEETGRNRTPDKLPVAERDPLFRQCDTALRQMAECLQPRAIVGVGAFAQARVAAIAQEMHVPTGAILHPSPASPRANRGWAQQAEQDLQQLGITL